MSGKFALIIGNTEYIDPGLAQLSAPGKDAEDFARILKDKDLCAFDEVKIVLNQLSSSVIETVDEFFDQKKPDDMLVLYFSGHGVRDEMGLLYLAVKNTIRSRLRSTAIRSDYIREAMDQSRSKRQILILDCCNSGAFPQGTKAEVGGAMGMTRAFQGYGRFVLTASDATQFAWEGDKVIGQTDNSLFTHFLVKGLEGEADRDGDGKITVDELYDYAYDQISRVTPKQTPTKSASKVEGEIVLRQFTRLEDIKPVALPDDLISEVEDLRPYVREAAVQKLDKILKGKNIGLARSAIEALEKIATDQNSTHRIAQAATHALESYYQLKRQAEELEKLQRAKSEREAVEREAGRLRAEREAAERASREAMAKEKAEKETAKRETAEKATRVSGKTTTPRPTVQRSILKYTTLGIIGLCLLAIGARAMVYFAGLGGSGEQQPSETPEIFSPTNEPTHLNEPPIEAIPTSTDTATDSPIDTPTATLTPTPTIILIPTRTHTSTRTPTRTPTQINKDRPAVWGWARADFDNQAIEMGNAGYRLEEINTYVLNGQEIFNGIWIKSNEDRPAVWGWARADFDNQAIEMRNAGYALLEINTYVLNRQEIFNGIWVK